MVIEKDITKIIGVLMNITKVIKDIINEEYYLPISYYITVVQINQYYLDYYWMGGNNYFKVSLKLEYLYLGFLAYQTIDISFNCLD